jgi:hypothetical protein
MNILNFFKPKRWNEENTSVIISNLTKHKKLGYSVSKSLNLIEQNKEIGRTANSIRKKLNTFDDLYFKKDINSKNLLWGTFFKDIDVPTTTNESKEAVKHWTQEEINNIANLLLSKKEQGFSVTNSLSLVNSEGLTTRSPDAIRNKLKKFGDLYLTNENKSRKLLWGEFFQNNHQILEENNNNKKEDNSLATINNSNQWSEVELCHIKQETDISNSKGLSPDESIEQIHNHLSNSNFFDPKTKQEITDKLIELTIVKYESLEVTLKWTNPKSSTKKLKIIPFSRKSDNNDNNHNLSSIQIKPKKDVFLDILLKFRKKPNGLFLFSPPTGTGKTHSAASDIFERLLLNINNEDSTQIIWFITDLRSNVRSAFDTLHRRIDAEDQLTSEQKLFIKDKIVFSMSNDDIIIQMKPAFFAELLNVLKINDNLKKYLIESHTRVHEYENDNNLKSLLNDANIKYIYEDKNKELCKYLYNTLK